MLSILMNRITYYIVGIVAILGYIGYLNYQISNLNEIVENQDTALKVVGREYEQVVNISNANEKKFKDTLEKIKLYEVDLAKLHKLNEVRMLEVNKLKIEVAKNENTSNDGNVSAVLLNTINGLFQQNSRSTENNNTN